MKKSLYVLFICLLLYSYVSVAADELVEVETDYELIEDSAVTEPAIDGLVLPWPSASTADEAFAETGFSLQLPQMLTENAESITWNYLSTPPAILEAVITHDHGKKQTIVRRGRKPAEIESSRELPADTVSYDDGFYIVFCEGLKGTAVSWSDDGFVWSLQTSGDDPDNLHRLSAELEKENPFWIEEEGWISCENLAEAEEQTGLSIRLPEKLLKACQYHVKTEEDPILEVLCPLGEDSSKEWLLLRKYATSESYQNNLPYSTIWTLEDGKLQMKGSEQGCTLAEYTADDGLVILFSPVPMAPSDMYTFIKAVDSSSQAGF